MAVAEPRYTGSTVRIKAYSPKFATNTGVSDMISNGEESLIRIQQLIPGVRNRETRCPLFPVGHSPFVIRCEQWGASHQTLAEIRFRSHHGG